MSEFAVNLRGFDELYEWLARNIGNIMNCRLTYVIADDNARADSTLAEVISKERNTQVLLSKISYGCLLKRAYFYKIEHTYLSGVNGAFENSIKCYLFYNK